MSFGQAEVGRVQSEWQRLREIDQVRRDRTRADRQKRDDEVALNATPETRRKLDRPVIDRLLSQGKIDHDQHRAAEEIQQVFMAVSKALFARNADYERVGGAGGSPGGFMPNIFTCGYQDRYLPWTRELERMPYRAGRNMLDLALMLVVDNHGPEQIAVILGSDRRTVMVAIQCALFRYCELAGWIAPKNMPLLSPEKAA